MQDVMLDIETFDTRTSAVVLSIGAVFFCPFEPALGETFYVELVDDIDGQVAMGRTVALSTVRWWLQQEDAARQLFSSDLTRASRRATTVDALEQFKSFLGASGGPAATRVWGNGAEFDNAIVASLYETYGQSAPWRFYNNRCFRTLKNLNNDPHQTLQRFDGVKHNALDDAIHQAISAKRLLKPLRLWR